MRKKAQAGVKRLFLSSIKVNGERTYPEQPFKYDDPRIGEDPYGKSKSEAELGLLKISMSPQYGYNDHCDSGMVQG